MKSLENEYKSLISTDLPDLWSRIESALPEKTNVTVVEEKKTKNKIVSFRKYIGVVAACGVCAVGIPAFFFIMNGTGGKTADAQLENAMALSDALVLDDSEWDYRNNVDGFAEETACAEEAEYEEAYAEETCDDESYAPATDSGAATAASEDYRYDDAKEEGDYDSDDAYAYDGVNGNYVATIGFTDEFLEAMHLTEYSSEDSAGSEPKEGAKDE